MAQSHESRLGTIVHPGALGGIRSLPAVMVALAAGGFDVLARWQTRSRERRHLLAMSDHLLRDIGVSRADIVSEAEKPFWRP